MPFIISGIPITPQGFRDDFLVCPTGQNLACKSPEEPGTGARVWGVARMKIALNIVGALLVLIGCIWFLQGINVLPGSFMTGQIRWAIYGGIAVAVGVSVLLAANRRRER